MVVGVSGFTAETYDDTVPQDWVDGLDLSKIQPPPPKVVGREEKLAAEKERAESFAQKAVKAVTKKKPGRKPRNDQSKLLR